MTEEEVKTILRNIPNSVSGDGKTFVAALKNYLAKSDDATNKKIDDAIGDATEKPNHVANITLMELHAVTDGVRSNNILINWDITPVEDYAKAEIWYKTDGNWSKAGEASQTQYVYQGAETGKTYYIRIVAVNKKGNAADFDTAPQASIKIKGSQYIPKAPTQFVLTWDEQGPLWQWLFEDNNYVDFFELRLDQNPGVWSDKRLDSTRETWSRANPGVRAGTAYLYIRNIFGEYSEPAVHQFNKALPKKPSKAEIVSTIDGVRIKMEALPLGCTGYKLHIKTVDSTETSDDYFETVNSEYIYFFFIGKITVSYCFMDTLGEGEWSDEVTATVKAGIDIGQVPTIDYDKFSDAIKDAIDIANAQPDINKLLETNINTNTVAINQTAESITAVVARVDNNEKNISSNTSLIQQNANSIASAVTRVATVEGVVTAQGTAINQTAESITAVVTELNKDPANCNYSSISQLQDDMLLMVKKDGVINAINISKEGIVIDGNKVHITGDTVFDNNVIVGGMIAADSIAMEHLRANSVSTAKIQANAIDSTKIKAGAVTADKIEAGAINAKHLAANSVGADAIQAGSVIGDKIAANTITSSMLATMNIDLLGALTITGGSVRLSEEGLRLTGGDGSSTLFDSEGINYIDRNGIIYAQVKKMIIGKAYDGQYIKFAAPWAKPPVVLMSPMSIQVNDSNYSASSLFLVCEATNVSVNGFKVNNYLRLANDSYNIITVEKSETPSSYTVAEMIQYWYGKYSYAYTFKSYSDVMKVAIPETAQYIEFSLQLTIVNPFSKTGSDSDTGRQYTYNSSIPTNYPNANGGWTYLDNNKRTIIVQLIVGGKVLQEVTFTTSDTTASIVKNFLLSSSFNAGSTQAIIRVTWNYSLKTSEHGSWSTLYNGRDYIAKATCKCELKRTYYKFSASEAKIARGYAMFLVTDGSTNCYSLETTVKVLIKYDGVPLASKTVLVNETSYTTNVDGYIEMSGSSTAKYTFTYGNNAPPIDATVDFTDGVITTVNIAAANVVCYIKVKYDGAIVANETVKINGIEKTTDADGKVEISGLDKHSAEYTVSYKGDTTTITVNYVNGSITTAELYSLQDGSKTWTWSEANNKVIDFTVPSGAHIIKAEAEVDFLEGVPAEENSASIKNTSNSIVWGAGYSVTDDNGENYEHKDIESVIAVTPGKTYSLLFDCASTNGVTFSWGREIDKLTANVTDT